MGKRIISGVVIVAMLVGLLILQGVYLKIGVVLIGLFCQYEMLHTIRQGGTKTMDVPVYAGCGQPMVREKMIAGDIHGETGLDGPVFPPLTKELEKEHAVNFIIKTLMESDGDITMVTTGPMTNLAMAMRMEPAIIRTALSYAEIIRWRSPIRTAELPPVICGVSAKCSPLFTVHRALKALRGSQ